MNNNNNQNQTPSAVDSLNGCLSGCFTIFLIVFGFIAIVIGLS